MALIKLQKMIISCMPWIYWLHVVGMNNLSTTWAETWTKLFMTKHPHEIPNLGSKHNPLFHICITPKRPVGEVREYTNWVDWLDDCHGECADRCECDEWWGFLKWKNVDDLCVWKIWHESQEVWSLWNHNKFQFHSCHFGMTKNECSFLHKKYWLIIYWSIRNK